MPPTNSQVTGSKSNKFKDIFEKPVPNTVGVKKRGDADLQKMEFKCNQLVFHDSYKKDSPTCAFKFKKAVGNTKYSKQNLEIFEKMHCTIHRTKVSGNSKETKGTFSNFWLAMNSFILLRGHSVEIYIHMKLILNL